MNIGLSIDRARSLLRAALDLSMTFNPQPIHLRIEDRCSGKPDHLSSMGLASVAEERSLLSAAVREATQQVTDLRFGAPREVMLKCIAEP
jgi:hypothetical protein